jgi:intraflagellar transport protein 172
MEGRRVTYSKWAMLRQMLFSVNSELVRNNSPNADEFDIMTTIAHYFAMKSACEGVGPLREISTKVTIALLRHTDLLCADRAFYEAGMACNQVGWENMAFVFLNRYLDLSEAIEDGDLDGLDNTDFLDTDIPFEIPLPKDQFLDESKREEVREYVLAISMDQKAEQTLDQDSRGTYVASLVDAKTRKKSSPCIVTGYPVLATSVSFGGKAGNKEDWNRFIMALKTSGTDELQDVMKFLAAWAGASTETGAYAF